MSDLDPTTRGDIIAEKVRDWYEANRGNLVGSAQAWDLGGRPQIGLAFMPTTSFLS